MQKIEQNGEIIELFENDIDLYLHQFAEEQSIEDFRAVGQSVWNGALMYVCKKVFKGDKNPLKQKNNTIISSNSIPSNFNAYNYELVNQLADYYIYLCSIYNKEVSIIGFSNLSGIDTETINIWGNDSNKLGTLSFGVYKKLCKMREESLSNKLADGKQNPVGVIAMLNRHYGWASPYTSDANKHKQSLSAAELPKLNGSTAQIEDKNGGL